MSEQGSGIWVPSPPEHANDGYKIMVCPCPGGAYLGARKEGTPCRCERCGFITAEQLGAILAVELRAAATALVPDAHEEAHRQVCATQHLSDRTSAHVALDVATEWLRARADALAPRVVRGDGGEGSGRE